MHSPHCANEPDATLPARGAVNNPNEDVFADSLQTPHKGESEGEEGMVVAAPTTKKRCASNPHCPALGTLLFSLCQ